MKQFFLFLALIAVMRANAQPLRPTPGLMAKFSQAMLQEQEKTPIREKLTALLQTPGNSFNLKKSIQRATEDPQTFASLLSATFRINNNLQQEEHKYLRSLRLTEKEAAGLTEYAMYLFAAGTKPDYGHAAGFRYGVKRFRDIAGKWFYIVTITAGHEIEMKRYATGATEPVQKITGTLNGNLVVTETDSLNWKYYFVEGVLGISKGGRHFDEYFESTPEGEFTGDGPGSAFSDYSLEKMTEYSEDSSEVRYPDPILVRLPYKPWFPGGKAGLAKYFETNLQYPEEARKNNVEGRIKVSLIVTEKGKVKDIETTGEHIGFGLEEEAIRLVRAMPDWVPGRQGGRAVKVKMTVPVDFDIMH